MVLLFGRQNDLQGHGLALLGGGYGAVQVAITGASWLQADWSGQVLVLIAVAKIATT